MGTPFGLWGYDDVMTGVDHAIAEGWADPDRLICYGWSYGGYMSFWMSTQTDRVKAISPDAGLTNLYSMYSTNDIQDYLARVYRADRATTHPDTGFRPISV